MASRILTLVSWLKARWRALAAAPWILPALLALAFAFGAPLLGAGWMLDDHSLLVRIQEGSFPQVLANLYRFASGDPAEVAAQVERGVFGWFATPDFRVHFFRPLAAATHVLDLHLGLGAWGMHLHSLAWFLAALLASWWGLRPLFPGRPARALALLFMVAAPGLVIPVGWISARNAPMGLAVAALALGAHLRWRGGEGRGFGLAAPLLVAVGLACNEGVAALAAVVLLYALLLEDGPLPARLVGAAPVVALVVAWWAGYQAAGFGVRGSGLYLTPAPADPAFYRHLAERLPVATSVALGVGAAFDLLLELPPGPPRLALVLGSTLTLALALGLLGDAARRDRPLGFWLLATLAVCLPACLSIPGDRSLGLVYLTQAGLWTRVVQVATRPVEAPARWRRWALLGFAAYLLVRGLVVGPLLKPVYWARWRGFCDAVLSGACGGVFEDPRAPSRTVVLVNAPHAVFVESIPNHRRWRGLPTSPRIRNLLPDLAPARVTRTGPRRFRVETRGSLRAVRWFFRDPDAGYQVGEGHAFSDMTLRVTSLGPDGAPATLEVEVEADPAGEGFLWARWEVDRWVEVPVPPVGGAIDLGLRP